MILVFPRDFNLLDDQTSTCPVLLFDYVVCTSGGDPLFTSFPDKGLSLVCLIWSRDLGNVVVSNCALKRIL